MFQPVVPSEGLAGWRFLQRTYDTQFATFRASPTLERDTSYFAEKIGNVSSAEELVQDRRLLTVALGAFGLQDDINNRFFIQKVLEEGTGSPDTLANRLADTRYRELSEAFGFGPTGQAQVGQAGFAEDIIARFEASSFEVAAGNQDNTLRVALYAERTLPELAGAAQSNDAKWFTILGDPPLRQVFEKALGLPSAIGQIDIDQQLETFKSRARQNFGSDDLATFADDAKVQEAITKYIVRDQIDTLNAGLSSTSIALTLLRG